MKSYIDEIMSILPSREIFDQENVQEYSFIQHISTDIEEVQNRFIHYCVSQKVLPEKFLAVTNISRQGIIGRYLDDCGNNEISKTWTRFMCIDDHYREWEQPYFAINYGKFWNVQPCYCLNSRPELVQFFRNSKINKILK